LLDSLKEEISCANDLWLVKKTMDWLATDETLARLVDHFEKGLLAKEDWHHAEHLAISFWHLKRFSFLEAVFRMKLGILKYNELYKIQQTPERGYHETITLFFLKLVRNYIRSLDAEDRDELRQVRNLLARFPDFLPLVWKHYSRPLLNSEKARTEWIEPDLEPLGFY
jgi:hypothetical protein